MNIQPNHPEAYQLIHQGLLALIDTNRHGMMVDVEYCKKTDIILGLKIKRYKKEFLQSKMGRLWGHVYNHTNLNSDQQLANILYDKLHAETKKTTDKGNPSVDNESLLILKKDFPELGGFIEYKKLTKVRGTYIQSFIKESVGGILRPSFPLHTTITYRSSSQNPNFQNIPNRDENLRKITRRAFIPRPGNQLVTGDFSGIEVGISCCNHLDPRMINYVKYPEKNNMHTDMAKQIYCLDDYRKEGSEKILRKGAKNGFVFPQFYGDYYGNNAVSLANWGKLPTSGTFPRKTGLKLMSGDYLSNHLRNKGIKSYKGFENHIKHIQEDFWNERFKVYGKWKKDSVKDYNKKGYLNLLSGFTCSGLASPNNITNYPIQGAAFHCLLKTFIKLNQQIKERKLKSRLIGQIHDELVLDAYPPEIETLKSLIKWIACEWLREEWPWIIVPLEIEMSIFEIDANWSTDSKVHVLRAA